MKLNIINASQNYRITGGSDRYFFGLDALLRQHGHNVIPFAAQHADNDHAGRSEYFPVAADFHQPGPTGVMRYIFSAPARRAMQRLLAENHVDLAHLHIYYGKLTASILSPLKKAGIPIIQTLHEFKLVCPVYSLIYNGKPCEACKNGQYWHAALKCCNRDSLSRSTLSTVESYVSQSLGSISHIDHFITVSEFQRKKIIHMGIPEDKVSTVPNFLDASDIKPTSKPGKYFFYFGRIERSKGIFSLIKAAERTKEMPLLIAGTGESFEEVAAYIKSHGLSHIKLLGFKKDKELHQLIRNALCTINPSECAETFGLSVLESFAHGRAVIASQAGGIVEVISDETDGLLYTQGDVDALADRMDWMATHPERVAEMGIAGRQKLDSYYHPERHYERIMRIYSRFL